MTRKELTRDDILNLLDRWIRQRPGLEFGNYGDVSAYRSELRSIARDKQHAQTLLAAVRWRTSIGVNELRAAFSAFSGRLQLTEDGKLEYCTGQYWPTEYRRAACAVLASALWEYTRNHAMPKGELHHNSETGETLNRYDGLRAGDWLRQYFKREFGRSIQQRWFD